MMNAKSFNLSVQGASHIKKNKECQDASVSFYDEKMAVAIVCDGHGGDDYMRSAAGSTFVAPVYPNTQATIQVDRAGLISDHWSLYTSANNVLQTGTVTIDIELYG